MCKKKGKEQRTKRARLKGDSNRKGEDGTNLIVRKRDAGQGISAAVVPITNAMIQNRGEGRSMEENGEGSGRDWAWPRPACLRRDQSRKARP